MPRHAIILCVDGTSQTPEKKSNVWRFFDALSGSRSGNRKKAVNQLAFYQTGVSAITGRGTRKRVLLAYEYLAEHYRAGDDVYLVGFSRGAAALRSLANMLHLCGLVGAADAEKGSRRAMLFYERNRTPADFRRRKKEFHERFATRRCAIKAMCLWDTVLHLGLRSQGNVKLIPHRYHRMEIVNTKKVFHAVATGVADVADG